jgi:hypothetical protein
MSIQKNTFTTTRNRCLGAALLVIGLLGAISAAAQSPEGCLTASASGSTFPLTLDTSVVSAKGTDEWNSEVIKMTVQEPGILIVSAEGPEVQGLVYTQDPAGGSPLLLDQEGIGSAGRILGLAVDPGDYCLQVASPSGTSGTLRVRADLIGLTVPIPE